MRKKELTNIYLMDFCTEISLFLQAGITLSDGILMLLDDESRKDGKNLLNKLYGLLDNGQSFSSALRETGCFPSYMVNMTETGERTGRLAEVMQALAAHYDRQERLVVSVKNATFYPAILLVMMAAVVFILIIYVLPIFNDIFSRLGAQMSPLAIGFMRFNEWLGNISMLITIVLLGIITGTVLLLFISGLRRAASQALKNIIGWQGVYGDILSSRFVSAMSLALASGLDNEEAITMATAVSSGVKTMDEKNNACMLLIQSGSNLSDAMRKAGILNARDSRALSLGMRTGMIDSAMSAIANRKERLTQDRIENMVSRIEPTLVIITSVIVGIILLSVMLPLMGIMVTIG